MNPSFNKCGSCSGGCGCGQCQPKCGCDNKCPKQCGCPESILSIEAETTNPANIRFNLGGRSVWYDFSSAVKASETCTNIIPDSVNHSLNFYGECQNHTISSSELGAIFRLSDIGDVDTSTLKDNAILVYKKDANCGENCDGKNGWIGIDPSEEGKTSLDYIMGSDSDGEVQSLMPPVNSNQFSYLTWAGKDKAIWKQPTIAASAPVDSDGKKWRVYMDPSTRELVIVKENS